MKGKEDLLDYLGRTSEHPTWVSVDGSGGEDTSYSPTLRVCHRNPYRGQVFDALETIQCVYFNEVWYRGELALYVGNPVIVAGNYCRVLHITSQIILHALAQDMHARPIGSTSQEYEVPPSRILGTVILSQWWQIPTMGLSCTLFLLIKFQRYAHDNIYFIFN